MELGELKHHHESLAAAAMALGYKKPRIEIVRLDYGCCNGKRRASLKAPRSTVQCNAVVNTYNPLTSNPSGVEIVADLFHKVKLASDAVAPSPLGGVRGVFQRDLSTVIAPLCGKNLKRLLFEIASKRSCAFREAEKYVTSRMIARNVGRLAVSIDDQLANYAGFVARCKDTYSKLGLFQHHDDVAEVVKILDAKIEKCIFNGCLQRGYVQYRVVLAPGTSAIESGIEFDDLPGRPDSSFQYGPLDPVADCDRRAVEDMVHISSFVQT
jgi:hypothetical protein